jgi:ribonucleoside-triphosphate reductase
MTKAQEEILTTDFLKKYKNKQPKWGYNGLGYIVYKRTYSRVKKNGLVEEWPETIARCINGAQKIGAGYTKKEAERLFDLVFHLKCNFAGRGLWQLGTSTVDRFGGNSLLNCWFTAIKKPDDFCFIFENLMLGGGVGYSIRREDIHELPRIKRDVNITVKNTNDADFIVPDSREGWVKLLSKVLHSYFLTGESFEYSTVLVRSAGKPINGFGGTASGPEILIEGINKISGVIKEREGKKLRSIDVLDIANIIGSVVVAGNVRRSAEIALGDPDDYLYIKAKRWDLGNIPNWRAMSNNTIYCDSYDHIAEGVWDGYGGNGEPYGFFNVALSSKFGRTGEKAKENCEGTNPCGEISLADKECCNLSELYLNNIESKQELIECSKLLYKTQKAICALPFLHEDTNKIVHKNFRIGQGITGICQGLHDKKLEWLDGCYQALKAFDKEWSKKRGWPESIKLTTVKPSGTLSLLAGATPGVHPAYSEYYIRRVRMSSQDALVETCKGMGYAVEYVKNFDGSLNRDTVIVEFPCRAGENAKLAKDMKAVDQLDLVKRIQKEWSDNAVSCTVYYKKEELGEIKEWLRKNYKNNIKSVSFLLHQDHGFAQAPYEEIDKKQYDALTANIKKVFSVKVGNGQTLEGLECEGGACPIK